MKPAKDSLVLYKQAPALVIAVGEKLEIRLPAGKTKNVREKDIIPLHPGPVPRYPDLESNIGEGQPQEAWELLQGESPSFLELTELVYGQWTPEAAWSTFKLLNRSPWFQGSPDAIVILPPEEAEARQKAAREKKEAEDNWNLFLERFKAGKAHREKDEVYLRDLEALALGRNKGSRILKALGKIQTPANAHRCLLQMGIREKTWNLHPLRLDIPLDIPRCQLAPLPEEPRRDLRDLEAFAIDDQGNTDPDDALSWDGERFWVHVADAAGLIPPGSEADELARERGSSLYLPETTIPMLPPEAVHRLGLGLQEVSPALSYSFILEGGGKLKDFKVEPSWVKVTRLSYEEANKKLHLEPFASLLGAAKAFQAFREDAGAVSLHFPEIKVSVLDNQPVLTEIPALDSRDMVTEGMLMAGYGAALFCQEQGIPIPFTTQVLPEFPKDLPFPVAKDDLPGQYGLRRYMKRSRTTLEAGPHGGLGLSVYSRVTSPLRRYPDLITSQQIRAFVTGGEPRGAEEVLQGLAAYENRIGRLIQAERASQLHWKMIYLSQSPRWQGLGVLVEKRERRGVFMLPELAMETTVPWQGKAPLGTKIQLAAKEVDIPEGQVVFKAVEGQT